MIRFGSWFLKTNTMATKENMFGSIVIVKVKRGDSLMRVWQKIHIRLTHAEILRKYWVFSN